jgi:hypothetical protein
MMGESIPQLFEVMEKKGVLSLFLPLIKDTLFSDDETMPYIVKQGIMLALSSRCSNSYCFVGHAFNLIDWGISFDNVKRLVRKLVFPKEVENHDNWSQVLQWAFLFGNSQTGNPADRKENEDTGLKLLGEREYLITFKICTINDIINRFTEFYAHEITVESEPGFKDVNGKLKIEIPNLVKFYQKISEDDNEGARPVVTMCMHCKNIRSDDGKWHALETTLSALDRRSLFSHSICGHCFRKHHNSS